MKPLCPSYHYFPLGNYGRIECSGNLERFLESLWECNRNDVTTLTVRKLFIEIHKLIENFISDIRTLKVKLKIKGEQIKKTLKRYNTNGKIDSIVLDLYQAVSNIYSYYITKMFAYMQKEELPF